MRASIQFRPERARRIDYLSSVTGCTKAFQLRERIIRGIYDAEDYYVASKVLEKIRSGYEQTSKLEDVEIRLGLVD